MNQETFDRALPSFARRSPFRPYVIELVSGERIVVRHPEAVAMHDEIAMFRNPRGEFHLFDCSCVCRLHDLETFTEGEAAS